MIDNNYNKDESYSIINTGPIDFKQWCLDKSVSYNSLSIEEQEQLFDEYLSSIDID